MSQKNQFETTTEKFERAVSVLSKHSQFTRKTAIQHLIKNLREKDEWLADYALSYFHGKGEI